MASFRLAFTVTRFSYANSTAPKQELPPRRASAVTKTQAVSGEGLQNPSAAVEAPPATEPKWKQKLAAAELHAEQTRQATARIQEEYRRRQEEERRRKGAGFFPGTAEEAAGAARGAEGSDAPLASLPWIPYIGEDGRIVDCSQEGAKASVYAVFDADRTLQYVGVTRQVYQSMRLHFARMPQQCVWAKVAHIARPSRSALEGIRDRWIAECGGTASGNDGGEMQQRWENAIDCKPLMTEEERRAVEEAAPGPAKAKALKQVARRVEAELEAHFRARQCTETLRFDPKLKESGLLDLKSTAYAPDTSVPKDKPKK